MAKKASKKSTGSTATRSSAKADSGASGDRLVGAVYHNGKMYDPAKRADQEAFKQLVQSEKNQSGEKKDKQGRTIAKLNLQHLADSGALVGYGTKSSAKAKRAAEQADADAEGQDEEQNPDAPVGGGIDAVEEQELMEQELEEQEEDR